MPFDDDSQYWIFCLPRRSQAEDTDGLDAIPPIPPHVPHSQFGDRSYYAQNVRVALRDSDGFDRMILPVVPEQERHAPAAKTLLQVGVAQ